MRCKRYKNTSTYVRKLNVSRTVFCTLFCSRTYRKNNETSYGLKLHSINETFFRATICSNLNETVSLLMNQLLLESSMRNYKSDEFPNGSENLGKY